MPAISSVMVQGDALLHLCICTNTAPALHQSYAIISMQRIEIVAAATPAPAPGLHTQNAADTAPSTLLMPAGQAAQGARLPPGA
jgi:hypothetical protein